MVRRLRAELHLAEALVNALRRLGDCLRKQLLRHEMRTRAGRKIAAFFDKTKTLHIDLTVALDGILRCLAGLRKRGRIQDDHIVFPPLLREFREKIQNIGTP